MKSLRLTVLAAVTVALLPTMASAVALSPEDLYKLTFLSNASISPNGNHVLVEAARMNGPKNTYDRSIELVDVSTGRLAHDVTKHLGDSDYAWMPDSRSFVFVRKAEKQKPQLYRYSLANGRMVQLTHIPDGVSSPVVSHSGDRIALAVTQTDAAVPAQIDFTKAGFSPKSSQTHSDIHVI